MPVPEKFYADCGFLAAWAEQIMATREPNLVIERDDLIYMKRWWLVPRNYIQNVYLHQILISDDDRALHDHPWDNVSFLIAGSYEELTPEGSFTRNAGDVISRKATDSHRLIIDQPVISIFTTGPMVREWGFHCPQGWVSWKVFTELSPDGKTSRIGKGCAE